jgi:hypothetical protein
VTQPGWLVSGEAVRSETPAIEFKIIRRSDSRLAKACSTLMSWLRNSWYV